ncbi:hypothetical protein BDF14DRAFT_246986 [Spinellus fusiger]|nr:hypothetical protein BDF14DRAFT_246986 [Spinellus fusiger]
MLTPQLNPQGYESTAVNNMTGFENAKYLLVHGTGDDNVHFQHSAVLIDKLTRANIHNYRVQFFTDSNHAIYYHNATRNLYYLLTEFLFERSMHIYVWNPMVAFQVICKNIIRWNSNKHKTCCLYCFFFSFSSFWNDR